MRLLLIFLVISASSGYMTQVIAPFEIYCNRSGNHFHLIALHEEDTLRVGPVPVDPDDHITNKNIMDEGNPVTRGNLTGWEDGDGIKPWIASMFGHTYTFYILYTTNCTGKREYLPVKKIYLWPSCQIRDESCTFSTVKLGDVPPEEDRELVTIPSAPE